MATSDIDNAKENQPRPLQAVLLIPRNVTPPADAILALHRWQAAIEPVYSELEAMAALSAAVTASTNEHAQTGIDDKKVNPPSSLLLILLIVEPNAFDDLDLFTTAVRRYHPAASIWGYEEHRTPALTQLAQPAPLFTIAANTGAAPAVELAEPISPTSLLSDTSPVVASIESTIVVTGIESKRAVSDTGQARAEETDSTTIESAPRSTDTVGDESESDQLPRLRLAGCADDTDSITEEVAAVAQVAAVASSLILGDDVPAGEIVVTVSHHESITTSAIDHDHLAIDLDDDQNDVGDSDNENDDSMDHVFDPPVFDREASDTEEHNLVVEPIRRRDEGVARSVGLSWNRDDDAISDLNGEFPSIPADRDLRLIADAEVNGQTDSEAHLGVQPRNKTDRDSSDDQEELPSELEQSDQFAEEDVSISEEEMVMLLGDGDFLFDDDDSDSSDNDVSPGKDEYNDADAASFQSPASNAIGSQMNQHRRRKGGRS